MKTIRFFRLLVLRIIVLTACVMAWIYLTEYVQEVGFFGDVYGKKYSWSDNSIWVWNWRHYVWCGMGVALVCVSIARIIVWGDWYWTQVNKKDDVDLKSPENKLF